MLRKFLSASIVVLGMLAAAAARDNGQWGNTSPEIRQWFQGLMQPDNPTISCCGEADAYEADIFDVEGDHYVAVITASRGASDVEVGSRIPVPNFKIKWDRGNPTGHGIIFLSSNMAIPPDPGPSVYVLIKDGYGHILYCYCPPAAL